MHVPARPAVTLLFLAVFPAFSLSQGRTSIQADSPSQCSDCAAWNAPHEPFRVFGNTYYVGVAGLSAVLITAGADSILLDGALPQSAVLIDAHIRALGFRTEDIRLIVNSHAHYDHAGGIAALQRASGARVAASASGARVLERGAPEPDDPQYGFGKVMLFPAVKNVRVVADGEVLRAGDLAITAHHTPGHTAGSTTWTWQSCEGARCLNMVYADSLNAVSAPGFRFTGDGKTPSVIDRFRATIARIEALPCDVIIAVHPAFADLDGKLARRTQQPGTNPFIDPNGCRAYAAGARQRLEQRVADEKR